MGRDEALTKVLYPGSFDPPHNGHLEIITTASRLFDEVVVAAMRNPGKGEPLFGMDDRRAMLEESVAHLPNVSVTMFSELVVDLARKIEADFIVKGLRGVSDFESEFTMAQMNHAVSQIVTVFIPSTSEDSYIASKYIREITHFGGDVTHLVPDPVARRLKEKFPQ